MEVQQLRQNLHLHIDQADPSLLRILNTLVAAYVREQAMKKKTIKEEVPVYNPSMKRSTTKGLKIEIQESRAVYEKGDFYSLEDLEKEMETRGNYSR